MKKAIKKAIANINKAIVENAIVGSKPRYFIKDDGSINEKEYAEIDKPFIHSQRNVNDETIKPVDTKSLDPIYVNFLTQKIDELKYITSNQDVGNGIAPSGITAGSAISALQESQGKNARSSNKAFHRAFREVAYHIVELIRQFYDVPRTFRINPDGMGEQFVEYDNSRIKPQMQQTMGESMGLRLPEFDIEVTSEKANPYKKMEINELALNFYTQGFFNPQLSDQAIACLKMMDFTKKDEVIQMISENGTIAQMLAQYQQLALQLANKISPQLGETIANQILKGSGQQVPQGFGNQVDLDGSNEHPYNERAREQARASTQAD